MKLIFNKGFSTAYQPLDAVTVKAGWTALNDTAETRLTLDDDFQNKLASGEYQLVLDPFTVPRGSALPPGNFSAVELDSGDILFDPDPSKGRTLADLTTIAAQGGRQVVSTGSISGGIYQGQGER